MQEGKGGEQGGVGMGGSLLHGNCGFITRCSMLAAKS